MSSTTSDFALLIAAEIPERLRGPEFYLIPVVQQGTYLNLRDFDRF